MKLFTEADVKPSARSFLFTSSAANQQRNSDGVIRGELRFLRGADGHRGGVRVAAPVSLVRDDRSDCHAVEYGDRLTSFVDSQLVPLLKGRQPEVIRSI